MLRIQAQLHSGVCKVKALYAVLIALISIGFGFNNDLGRVNVRIFLVKKMQTNGKNKMEQELLSLVRLHITPSISLLKALRLYKKFKSATAIFERELQLLQSKDFHQGVDFFSKNYLDRAMTVLKEAKNSNYQLLGYGQKGYPSLLMECDDAPLILFASGSIQWNTQRWISVVGTRSPSPQALKLVEKLIRELAPYKPTIVSGLAYGIDIAAHKAALKYDLQTIGCMAHGLHRTYPLAHSQIRKMMEQKGGVISEFLPKEAPLPYKFVQRNRIIAGLTKATIVVESPLKGGSLITADLANSYNREVFAFPSRCSDPHQGCNHLIRDAKAQLICSVQDLVQFLGWD
jgi:DNA processing protein